jgi:hypothetical protein
MDETIGNQQVTQTDLAWLGGIWDGEGTISIRRTIQKNGGKPQYSPRVSMVNTNTLILSKVKNILDSLEVSYYFREKEQGGFEGSFKQCWIISVDNLTNASRLLENIRPFLFGKGFQADCLMEFCDRRIKVSDRKIHNNEARKYTARDYELVGSIYDANGNQRGTSETTRCDAEKSAMI